MTDTSIKHIVLREVRLRTQEERVPCVTSICPNSVGRIQLQGNIGEWRAHIFKNYFNRFQFLYW